MYDGCIMKNRFKRKKKSNIASIKPTVTFQKQSLKDILRINLLPVIFLSYTLVVILVFSVLLSGGILLSQNQLQASDDTSRFIGTWTYQNFVESFNADGSYSVDTVRVGTWKVSNGTLSIYYGTSPTSTDYTYVFSNNDSILTLTGISSGITKVYTR